MAIPQTWNAYGAAVKSIQQITEGTAVANTNLAATFALLTPAQIANIAATQQLGEADLEAAMKEAALTKEQQDAVWAAYNAAAAKGTDAAVTNTLTFSMGNLTAALWANIKALAAWLFTNPVGQITLVIGVITALVAAHNAYNKAIQESIEKAQELQDAYKDASNTIANNAATVKDLASEFNELSKGVGSHGENVSLSADEYDRYLELVKQLVDINPALIQGYDAEGNAIVDKNGAIQQTIDLLKEQQALELAQATSTGNNWDIAKGLSNAYQQAAEEAKSAQNDLVWSLAAALREQVSNEDVNQLIDVFGLSWSKLDDSFDLDSNTGLAYWTKLFGVISNTVDDAGGVIADNIGYINGLLDQSSSEAAAFRQALSAWQTAEKTADRAATAYQSQMKLIAQAAVGYDELSNSSKDFVNTWIEAQKLTGQETEESVAAITASIQNMVNLLATGMEIDGEKIDLNAELDKLFQVDWDALGGSWYDSARQQAEQVIEWLAEALSLSDEQVVDLKLALGLVIVDPETGEPVDTHTYYAGLLTDKLQGVLDFNASDVLGMGTADLKIALKLNPSDYSGWDGFRSAVEAAKVSLANATAAVHEFTDAIASVATYEDAYDELVDALDEFIETGVVSADTVSSLIDTFGDTAVLEEFIVLLGQEGVTSDQIREALNQLGEEYLSNMDILSQLTEENAGWVAAVLEANGVINAQEVVANRLAAQQLELKYATELASLATWDEVRAFLQEQGASAQVISALAALRTEQLKAKIAAIDFATASQSVTTALITQAQAAGASAKAISALKVIYAIQGALETATNPAQIARLNNQLEVWQGRLQSELQESVSEIQLGVSIQPTPSSTSSSSSSSSSSSDPWKEEFEAYYEAHKHAVAMEQETLLDFYKWLDGQDGYKKYFANQEKYLDEYRQYAEEVFDGLKDLFSGLTDDMSDYYNDIEHYIYLLDKEAGDTGANNDKIIASYAGLKSYTLQAINDVTAAMQRLGYTQTEIANSGIIQELQKKLWEYEESIDDIVDTLNDDLYDSMKTILDLTIEMVKQEKEDEKDALQSLIDDYEHIISLRKQMLQSMEQERQYQQDVADKTSEISKLQARIDTLSLDDSRAAAIERASLEEQLYDLQRELSDLQREHTLDAVEDQLDKELDDFETAQQKKIDVIEEFLNNNEALNQAALARLDNMNESLFNDLLSYTLRYTSTSRSELEEMWNAALGAAQGYGSYLDALTAAQNGLFYTSSSLGAGGTSNPAATVSAVQELIGKMKANSMAWYSGNQTALANENLGYGAQISQLLGGVNVSKDTSGVWWIDGQKLYDVTASTLEKYAQAVASSVPTVSGSSLVLGGSGSSSSAGAGFSSGTGSASGAGSAASSLISGPAGSGMESVTTATFDQINSIIKQMKANSSAWWDASTAERNRLAAANEQLAKQLSTLTGMDIVKGLDGAWYYGSVGGARVFHDGGIVGTPSLKQNELFALVKNKELILNEVQQNNLMGILEQMKSLSTLKDVLSTARSGAFTPAMAGASIQVDASVSIDGTLPEKQIIQAIVNQQRKIANIIYQQIGR